MQTGGSHVLFLSQGIFSYVSIFVFTYSSWLPFLMLTIELTPQFLWLSIDQSWEDSISSLDFGKWIFLKKI